MSDAYEPNNPLRPFQPKPQSGGWSAERRGKFFPPTRASWNQVDSNNRTHDPELGRKVLDESLG
jgi:hypothetical protein